MPRKACALLSRFIILVKKSFLLVASALTLGAALFFTVQEARDARRSGRQQRAPRRGFIYTRDAEFMLDGRPFRFVGANAAVIYGDEERARMPEALRQAAIQGVRVIRIWASGESGSADPNDWIKQHPFRRGPHDWNEEAFQNLDRVLAEAARHNLRVQICLSNWWRDTGGVVEYLRWAGITDAADARKPYGINFDRAMLFYTNEETRKLYREHVERIVMRRNSLTGVLYRDDPTIFGYELMNEAQAVTGRWAERRAWVAEMSAFLKSIDPDHLVAPGVWGYRTSWERREWLADHHLASVDYCDVHSYPADDQDTYIETPEDLRRFVDNRAAAGYDLKKPLMFGEFGMVRAGYKGFSQTEWFRAFFESVLKSGAGGALYWRMSHDVSNKYSITYDTSLDEKVRAEITRAARLFASQEAKPPSYLLDAGRHLVPHQFAFQRDADDAHTQPELRGLDDGTLLYSFKPESAASARFEQLGSGNGYIWGSGAGHFEYLVPAREKYRRVKSVTVRAHLQPVAPVDANPSNIQTRVTLFINRTNCGSRLISKENPPQALVQEWRVDLFAVRLRATRGKPLSIRFVVTADADHPFGINISNWPEGYDSHGRQPIEVEIEWREK